MYSLPFHKEKKPRNLSGRVNYYFLFTSGACTYQNQLILIKNCRKKHFHNQVHVKQSCQLEHIYCLHVYVSSTFWNLQPNITTENYIRLHGRMLTYLFLSLLLSSSEVSAGCFGLRAFRSSYSRAKWRLLSLCFSATLSESSFNFIGLKKI